MGDIDAFAATIWGKQPCVRTDAGPFTDLLSLDAVDTILTSSPRRPTFRMVADGKPLPHAAVTTSLRLGGTTVDDVADVSRIGEHLAAGATLVLQGLQRTWPPLVRFCRALERATSHPVQANAYLTPPGAAGLGEHADGHDVLVLQAHGTKAWTVDGLGDLELHAGDVLYMPTGTRHRAAAQAAVSLHLTVGLLSDTYRSVVRRALDGVQTLDAPLPLGWARPEHAGGLADGLRAALESAAKHLGSAAASSDVAAAEIRRARTRRRPLLEGHIASVLARVDDATVVRRRRDNPVTVQHDRDDIVVELVDRSIRMPGYVLPAIEAIVELDELTVGELPGLDEPGRAVLARRLIREGLLEAT